MRRVLIAGAIILLAGCATRRETVPVPSAAKDCAPVSTSGASSNTLYFIDDRASSADDVARVCFGAIASIQILRGSAAVSRYGPEARNGVILVYTKTEPPTNRAR
jgi:TonB-dependent SusC/RagA subfamily outer membrane receptor